MNKEVKEDEREYLLTALERRIVNLMEQWEYDVANALYENEMITREGDEYFDDSIKILTH